MIKKLFAKAFSQESQDAEILLVTGSGRTGTSTLLGMLNCSSQICLLFEVNANRAELQKRDLQFVTNHPEVKMLFGSRKPFEAYASLARHFADRGYRYRYFGAKIPSVNLTEEEFSALANYKNIVLVRNIRSWLCKNNNVRGWNLEASDAVVLAIEVGVQYLRSFKFPRCLRLTMEELVLENDRTIEKIGTFLELDLKEDLKDWWTKVGQGDPQDPKTSIRWWQGHDSSKLRPTALDTQATLKPHPFWDAYLPIFDKYYNNPAGNFSAEEVSADIKSLEACIRFSPASVPDLYESVQSVSFGSGEDGAKGHRSTNEGLKPFSL